MNMSKSAFIGAVVTALVVASVARADYPVVDKVADKLIQKYQSASCQELQQQKAQSHGKTKSATEERAIQMLHEDAGARTEFFSKVSAPIVNKLFECGMIP